MEEITKRLELYIKPVLNSSNEPRLFEHEVHATTCQNGIAGVEPPDEDIVGIGDSNRATGGDGKSLPSIQNQGTRLPPPRRSLTRVSGT